jgi:hypothetical protein
MWRAWMGSVSICFFVLGDSALLVRVRLLLDCLEEEVFFLVDFVGMLPLEST